MSPPSVGLSTLGQTTGDAVRDRHALDVMMINTRPELDPTKSPALPATRAGVGAPTGAVGSLVSDLIGAGVSDADGNPVGMAATAVSGGTLYYSLNGGGTWTAASAIPAGSALLLAPTARVYFAPADGATTTIANAVTFRAWDGTLGADGTVASIGGPVDVLTQDAAIGGRFATAVGNHVLIHNGNGIDVVALSGATPTKVGTVVLPTLGSGPGSASVDNMASAGNLAYVLASDMGSDNALVTYDLGTPAQPTQVSLVSLGDYGARAIDIVDGIAYIATGTSILRYSLANPGTPVAMASIAVGSNTAMGVSNDLIMVGNYNNVLTVINRATGSTVGTLNGPPPVNSASPVPYDIAIKGQYAFVAIGREGVHIADLSDPAHPQWVGSIATLSLDVFGASGAEELTIVGNHLFVASHPTSAVYDITNPLAPVEKQHFTTNLSVSVTPVNGKVLFGSDTGIVVVTDGNANDSVSTATDTVAIDIAPAVDNTPPTIGIEGGATKMLSGDTLTVTSNEAGTVYVIKSSDVPTTLDQAGLTQLVQDQKAVAVTVSNGKAGFATADLLGAYTVVATDTSGNVSTTTTVTILTKPTMSGLASSIAFTEGDAPIAIAPALALSDMDSGATGLASAKVQFKAVVPGADEALSLTVNPATMGALVATYTAATGTLDITGTATLAQWQAALRAVTYSNGSANPVASRTLAVTVVDTEGATFSTSQDIGVTITAVDNAPTFSGVPAAAVAVKAGVATALQNLSIVDPDSGTITATLKAVDGELSGLTGITPVDGVYTLTGSVSTINTALASARFTLQKTTGHVALTVSDGNTTNVTGQYAFQDQSAPTVTITGGTGGFLRGATIALTSNEDGVVYLVQKTSLPAVVDRAALDVLVTESKAVKADLSLGQAQFASTSLLGEYAVVSFDAVGNTATAARSVTVYTAPAITLASAALPFTEGDAPLAVAAGLTLADADDAANGLAAAYLRIKTTPILVGGAPVINLDAAESLALTIDASMGGLSATYDADNGILQITGNATLAQWEAALRAVTYRNTSKNPVAGRDIEITVADAGDHVVQRDVRVNITAVNDAPSFVGVPAGPQQVSVGTPVTLTGLSVVDPDSTSVTVTAKAVNGTLGNVGGWTDTPDGYVFTGTPAAVSTALAGLTFTLGGSGNGHVALTGSDGAVTLGTARYEFAPPPPVVVPPTGSFDGVPVQVSTGADGQQQIIVPVVTQDRTEDTSTPNSALADIPVVKNPAGVTLLNVGIPVGTGIETHGPATTVSSSNAQSVLDARIGNGTSSSQLKAAGQAFLNGLPSETQVVVQAVKLTAQASGGSPLTISATNLGDGHKTALVIDTSALPAGTTINLANVDFAVIVGNARVVGGAGANIAYGDDANQFIVLGEGDDILHGEGGNDTVGSLRGNDQTFGDGGDDVVYGGTGNDTLHGGAGNDRMNGGFGLDTAVQSGVLNDYTVTVDGHSVVLTNKGSGEIDRFLDVEHIVFDSGTSLIVAHEAGDVAGLTAQFADAQLIQLNANRAVTGTAGRDAVTPDLGMALNVDLGAGVDIVRLAGARSDVHIDVEAGQRAELTRLADGAMLAFNNVEMLAFANGNVTVLAHNHQEAVLGRAYELLLGRNVDTDGYTFWLEGIQAGVSLASTLTSMMAAPEYTGAASSNSAFVDLLYTNGLGRAADADGKAFWVGALDAGVSRAQIIEGFATTTEAVAVIGSTIDVTVVS